MGGGLSRHERKLRRGKDRQGLLLARRKGAPRYRGWRRSRVGVCASIFHKSLTVRDYDDGPLWHYGSNWICGGIIRVVFWILLLPGPILLSGGTCAQASQ